MRALLLNLFLVSILSAITACTDAPETKKSTTNVNELVAKGEQIFNKKHLGKDKVIGCVLCHSTEQGRVVIGPSLAGLSIRAPHLVEGMSAKQYIRESITNPDGYIAEGFTPAVMLANFEAALSKEELDALVAYLMTL